MFPIASYETYQDGQVIFREHSHGDWIYVVEEGAVEISTMVDGVKIDIDTLQPGAIFGELAYLAKIPRTATATAIGTTTVGILDRTIFDREWNQLRSDFQELLRAVASRLKKANDAIARCKAEHGK
jgi:CRP/FNR family transcriptional regulator, cyclic AMP receptor protein